MDKFYSSKVAGENLGKGDSTQKNIIPRKLSWNEPPNLGISCEENIP